MKDLSWETTRALALLLILNPLRLDEASGNESPGMRLAELVRGGEARLDECARWTLDRFELGIRRAEPELFFTEVASFAIPQPAGPLLAIPLALNVCLVARDGNVPDQTEFLKEINQSCLIQSLSLGVGQNARRVLLPPVWREAFARDPAGTREAIFTLRESAREICRNVAAAGRVAGVGSWDVT